MDDDVASYFLTEGHNLPGDLVLGDRALERALRQTQIPEEEIIPDDARSEHYPERAASAQEGAFGSSAGGEQPKFLAIVQRPDGAALSVIVKFSPAEDTPMRQRWADLLLCEFLAAQVLERHQIPCSRTQLLDGGGRRFLEVERFDRFSGGGRRGVLSLGAADDALIEASGPNSDWTATAAAMETAGVLDASAAEQLRWRWCFGDMIGNSDMHRSNTSLWFGDTLPFALTPSYDMLPMLFAPNSQGDIVERRLSPRPPSPLLAAVWPQAAAAASEFWSLVSDEPRLSADFRAIARLASLEVARMIDRFG
jgi:hypothetical protein